MILTVKEFLAYYAKEELQKVQKLNDSFFGRFHNLPNSIKEEELLVLGLLVSDFKPKNIVETGTNIGVSTSVLALHSDSDCLLKTYDIPNAPVPHNLLEAEEEWGKFFRGAPFEARISKHNQNTFSISPSTLPSSRVLWFFDSDHSLETVTHEVNLALSTVKGEALLIFHDALQNTPWKSDVYQFLLHSGYEFNLVETTAGIAYIYVDQ